MIFEWLYVCLFGGVYVKCSNCKQKFYSPCNFDNNIKFYYCSNDCANSLIYNNNNL